MGAVKDTYDIIKDLLGEAKKLKNFEFVEMVIDIQQRFFELNAENEEFRSKNETLKSKIKAMEGCQIEIEKFRIENSELKEKLSVFQKLRDVTFLDKKIQTKYIQYRTIHSSGMPPLVKTTLEETIRDVYYYIAPKLLSPIEDSKFREIFYKTVNETYSYLDDIIVGQLKAKFLEHNLIQIVDRANKNYIQLTIYGQEVLNKINGI